METTKKSSKKTRSPGYPWISLDKAIERAKVMQEHEQRNSAPKEALANHWGYGGKSSGLLLTISSLRQYGLIDGRNDMFLTDLAWGILFGSDTEKVDFIKGAAIAPDINKSILNNFNSMPSDITLRNYLIRDKQFNSRAAEDYVKVFKNTISFAKLEFGVKIEDESAEQDTNSIQDIVQKPMTVTVTPIRSSQAKEEPRQTSFNLSTGNAYFIVPAEITKEDKALLSDYLKIWERGLKVKESSDK